MASTSAETEVKPVEIQRFVFFGMKFHQESDGILAYLVNETTDEGSCWDHLLQAIIGGQKVFVRPANEREMACAEASLAIMKANQQSALC